MSVKVLSVAAQRPARAAGQRLSKEHDPQFAEVIQSILSCSMSRTTDHMNSGCTWNPSGPKLQHLFGRQALPIVWDFCEANPFGDSVGDWMSAVECAMT